MTANVSTRYKELILGPNSFESIFNGGRIVVFTGPQPATADMPVVGTMLAEISTGGIAWAPGGTAGGLQFQRDGVWISKQAAANWRMKGIAAGTAGWFRLFGPLLDDGGYSFAAPRIDGAIGFDMVLDSNLITTDTNLNIEQFLFSIPPVLGA